VALVSKKLKDGTHAEFYFDPGNSDVLLLSLDGLLHSAVNVKTPEHLHFNYIKEVGFLVDFVFFPNAPVKSLFLGGGAYSVARYIEATRPSSRQKVIEINQEIIDFVEGTLPLKNPSLIEIVCGDAYEEIMNADGSEKYDFIFVDVFSGPEIDSKFLEKDFVEKVDSLLQNSGLISMNLTDTHQMTNTTKQINNMLQVGAADSGKMSVSVFSSSANKLNKNVVLSYRKRD